MLLYDGAWGQMGRFWIEDWVRLVDLPRFYAAGQTVPWFGGGRFIMGSRKVQASLARPPSGRASIDGRHENVAWRQSIFLASSGSKQRSAGGDCVRRTAAVGWRWLAPVSITPRKSPMRSSPRPIASFGLGPKIPFDRPYPLASHDLVSRSGVVKRARSSSASRS